MDRDRQHRCRRHGGILRRYRAGAGRGPRGRRRHGRDRPPTRLLETIANLVRRPGDDRDHGDLLPGNRAARAVRQSVHPLRPCISIGGHWRSRPSTFWSSSGYSAVLLSPGDDIVAKRQAEADAVLADATALKQQAAEGKAAADRARAEIEAQRQQLFAEAQKEASTRKARLLELASNEIAITKAEAAAATARERTEMEEALLARTKALVIDIARRLLVRIPPESGFDSFVEGLSEKAKTLPPETLGALRTGDNGLAIEVVTAAALTPEAVARLREKLQAVLGVGTLLQFDADPAVLAGIELHGGTVSLNNSLRQDLDQIIKNMNSGA